MIDRTKFVGGNSTPLALALACLCVTLIAIICASVFGDSIDRSIYLEFLSQGNTTGFDYRFEPATYIVRSVAQQSEILFFGIFASISVCIRVLAMAQSSKQLGITLCCYFLSYFFLHDYTQLRAAVASALFLSAIVSFARDRIFVYLLKCLLATTFHYSSIALVLIFPFLLIKNLRVFQILPLAGFTIAWASPDAFQLTLQAALDFSPELTLLYHSKAGPEEIVSPLSIVQLSFFGAFLVTSYFIGDLDKMDRTLFKVYSLALTFYYASIPLHLPTVTFRVTELLLIVSIIFLPNIATRVIPRGLANVSIITLFAAFLAHLTLNVGVLI